MNDKISTISIVIPTYNSEKFIERCLKGIVNQNYPKKNFEIIIVDNNSSDNTIEIAEKYNTKIIFVDGEAPQVCTQRNVGIKNAVGDYVYILDHDREITANLLKVFNDNVLETHENIDAWFVQEKIVGNNKFWNKIRSYERNFYTGTVVDAARIFKRKLFDRGVKYDESLSSGPADWDLDNQLKQINCSFGVIVGSEHVNHFEKYVTLKKYLLKKNGYSCGSEIYQNKWRNLDIIIYNKIVKKQFGFFYRYVSVFFTDKKWKEVLKNLHLFFPMMFVRFCVGLVFIYYNIVWKRKKFIY